MIISNDLFINEVKLLYLNDPCKTSSIAFWKTENILKTCETYKVIEGENVYLYAIKDNKLLFYWSNQKNECILRDKDFDFIVIHEDFYNFFNNGHYDISECIPLIYKLSFADNIYKTNLEYKIQDFYFNDEEFSFAATLINSAYEGLSHYGDEIKSWMNVSAFDKNLWFWVVNRETNEKAALAISTYQEGIKETYLDWIQVSPKYHKKGLGKLLLNETIKRVIYKSNIIRVTGIADDFYMKNGFISKEKWYIMSKK